MRAWEGMEPKVKTSYRRHRPAAEVEALIMSIGDGVFVTDVNSRVSRINQAALDILGFEEKEILGKWFPEAVPVEDEKGNKYSNFNRPMARAFLAGRPISERAYYRRKDGSRVPVFLSVSPVILDGKPIGAIEVFRDISEELALEKAKDEFVAIASHQLRTPATAVKQYVGLLLEGYAEPLTDSQRMFLQRAYESNERQLHIVHEILKISQLDLDKVVFKPAVCNIGEIVREAVATIQPNFDNKNQPVELVLPKKPLKAKVDPEQLRIAVENLLENASNYTRNGKKISVTVRKNSGKVQISVKDQGVGIDPKDRAKLFQKFSRLPNPLSVEVGGTGLGLYWALKIIEMHKGEIKLTSALEKGSTFTILLPDAL